MYERNHFRLLATINPYRLQVLSLVLLLIATILEFSVQSDNLTGWKSSALWGLLLGLIIFGMSFNVKIIRSMGIPQKIKNRSILLLAATAIFGLYLFILG